MSDAGAAKTGTGTTQRLMALLSLLADAGGPVSVRHVAETLGLAPSTSHRLLNLLVQGGFASFEARTSTYGVGAELYRVSARISATVTPATVARAVIDELAGRHDETVLFALWLPTAGRIAFVERADGQEKLLYRIDMHTPLSLVWGASGKAALAHLPPEEIRRVLASEGRSPATGAAPPAAAEIEAELERVRTRGFSISHGEKLAGAVGIAAPVFGPNGVLGTICMTRPKSRAPRGSCDALGAEIAEAARRLSEQLGGKTP